jgi:Ser/Thr protein kinase RdoA (MazF antagonist)
LNDDKTRLIQRIVTGYGLSYTAILPPQKGYRNQSYPARLKDGRIVNIILYKSEPGALALIQHANQVSDYLSSQGFPCRKTLGPIAKLSNHRLTKYAALYNYLRGQTIPWEAYTKRHIKLLGKTLSDMHAALAGYKGDLPDIAQTSIALNKRILRYFANANVAQALRAKLNLRVCKTDFRQLLTACQLLPSQQALHMDLVRSNILFEGEGDGLQISGILDFEKTARGSALFDIARTLAFLIVDCKYKDEQKVRKYFLHSGYRKRGAGDLRYTATTKRLLDELVAFNLLHDFYKFLRHNPYEHLPQNEHFVRTRDLLIARNIIE